jgi:TonB family protein
MSRFLAIASALIIVPLFAEAGAAQTSGGTQGGIVGGVTQPPPAPPPPIRVGSGIRPPRKVKDVRPVYPAVAQSARVQGVVVIEATIRADGTVAETKVVRSIPLLDQAAVDAVRQWVFEPTLVNGVAVPVITIVTVNFSPIRVDQLEDYRSSRHRDSGDRSSDPVRDADRSGEPRRIGHGAGAR